MLDRKNLLIVKKDAMCTVVINNPKKRNALTPECLFDIARTFDDLSRDQDIKVVILRGAGQEAFSAGSDISSMPRKGDSSGLKENQEDYSNTMEAIRRFPYPTIAMLYGYTLGAGCILAIACDIRVVSSNVKMGVPTSRMGLLPDHSVFKRFLAVLGYSTALEIFLTGQHYDARACLTMGLANHVVEHDQVERYTYALADEIIKCAPLSLRGSKYILSAITENPNPSVQEIDTFRALSKQAAASDDHEEAKRAFKEKRKPLFSGH